MKENEDMQTKEVIQQVGQLLRQIRNEQKLSLEELAHKTGVSKLTLGKIERGNKSDTSCHLENNERVINSFIRINGCWRTCSCCALWGRICSR